jgi:hypothetical protein
LVRHGERRITSGSRGEGERCNVMDSMITVDDRKLMEPAGFDFGRSAHIFV